MRKTIIILLFTFSVVHLFANGGITVKSSVNGTGDPTFIEMTDVTLISEKLYIKLEHEYSTIKVKYILWNNSNKDYKDLNYGFPVDFMNSGWESRYMKEIKFTANDKLLPHTDSPTIIKNESIERKWFYTHVSIPKHSFLTLEVEYTIMNGNIDDVHSPLMLYKMEMEGSYLAYDFSPAVHWGDGIIRDFYVEVDMTSLEHSGRGRYFTVYFPDKKYDLKEEDELLSQGIYVEGINLKKEGNFYTYRTRNFDLKEAKPLIICYSSSTTLENVLNQKINGNEYTITASTETAKYPVSNLTDMNLETAWVAGNKGGIGEWVEFTFKNKVFPKGFTLVNGYTKNENTYYENNRIKKITLDIKEAKREDYVSHVIDFQNDEYKVLFFDDLIYKVGWYDFFDDVGNDIVDPLWNEDDRTNYIEKVRFTIMDVYPGSKYDDTCISEILFYK